MSASSVILPIAWALGLCLLLTPLLRDLAVRLGWVDRPDFGRKIHQVPVPRIGGIPVVIACAACYGTFLAMDSPNTPAFDQSLSLAWILLPASLLIFVTGVVDDLIGLKPIQKLGGQVLAAALACLGGLHFQIFDGYKGGDVWGVALTLVWLVACTNAFNLIDGVDGVAAGLGFIATLTTLLVALLCGNVGLGVLAAIMAGSLLGFLRFNFNPASIFLGDSGSLWTGFMLGCFGVVWSQSSATLLGTIAPVVALSIPLADTSLAITRRFVAGKPIFIADREHIHHRLLQRGFTARRVALSLYGASGLASCLALLLSVTSDVTAGSILIVLFCAAAWMAIRRLGYQEFSVLAGLLRNVRSHVQPRLLLNAYERRLREADNPEECWHVVCQACGEFGFTNVTLRLGGCHFHEQTTMNGNRSWKLHLPLSESDYISLTRPCEPRATADTVVQLADLLHRTLLQKAATFRVVVENSQESIIAQNGKSHGRRQLILEPEIQHRWVREGKHA